MNRADRFVLIFKTKCAKENILLNAGALSYLTILSLVPLFAVTVSIFSAFPAFKTISTDIESFLFTNFVPAAGEQVQQAMQQFIVNASQMTAVGLFVLVATALMLMSAIDNTVNQIWHSDETKKFSKKLPIYWAILSLGPILIGSGIAATSYLFGMSDGVNILLKALPYLTSIIAFLLIYLLIPTRSVRFKDALSGAVAAAIIYEICKKGFALYISTFPAYQTIYGALAAVPIMFIWIYISWIVVLLGAVITYCLGECECEAKGEGECKEASRES
ncbi:MAG: virulence factor BrkB family protein [Thiotrichales bacterium]|jgi:membrane protein|nr:virulence factor BrkB family protein [Thiotrichales bacterium]MBT3613183.1 virulence factor BrkB family protein [Thiotrichales bacterium]MBT3752252.1 virulence factor BrkB family protein [Thiotrichales bacterium]MBT3837623.1 virulence factor BrkB family protein [Thiotrichales bacterium]MBT4261015.1 virulence factor BrkB family protein [Thiotrichales bacterium]